MADQATDLLDKLSPELGARVQQAALALLLREGHLGDDRYIYEMSHFMTRFRELDPDISLADGVRTLLELIEKGVLRESAYKANHLQYPRADMQRQWAAEHLHRHYLGDPDLPDDPREVLADLSMYLRGILFDRNEKETEEKLDEPFEQILVEVLELANLEEKHLDDFLTKTFVESGHVALGIEFIQGLERELWDRTRPLLGRWKNRSYTIQDEDRKIFKSLLGQCSRPGIVRIRNQVFVGIHERALPNKEQLIDNFLQLLDEQRDKEKWLVLLASLHRQAKATIDKEGTRFIDFANCASEDDEIKAQRLFQSNSQLNSPATWQEFLNQCNLPGLLTDAELVGDNPGIVGKIMKRARQAILDGKDAPSILRQLLRGANDYLTFTNDTDQNDMDSLLEAYHVLDQG